MERIDLILIVGDPMPNKEATARIKINKLLEAAGWRFFAEDEAPANIRLEPGFKIKTADLDVLGENFEKTARGFPLIILEARSEDKNPLVGKEQARKYARSQNCRFVILSNGNLHYFWDLERGSPYIITSFPTPESVIGYQKVTPNPQRLIEEPVGSDYIVLTQRPSYQTEAATHSDLPPHPYPKRDPPLNNLPRQKMIEIIARYGPQTIDDPRRMEGLLRDLCGDCRLEINALLDVARERVALELRDAHVRQHPELLVASLTQRVLVNRPMSEEMARWAVESWALALGVIAAPAPAIPPPARPAPTINQAPPPAGNEITLTLAPGVDMKLLRVSAGEFLMGSDKSQDKNTQDREKPQHSVRLDEYWMGAAPVTNSQYAVFVRSNGVKAPLHWEKGVIPSGKEQHPVVNVSWQDAMDFCRWLDGKKRVSGLQARLPTEAEWEKAARGTDGRLYPWGNAAPDEKRCNFNNNVRNTTPVGKYSPQGDSPYGCADMAGNVFEWVSDWYNSGYYAESPSSNPSGPSNGDYHVVRGGSWDNGGRYVRSADRFWFSPASTGSNLGFRGFATLTP